MPLTVVEAKKAVQDLIDRFPDGDDFLECCEEMIDLATTSRDARQEELEGEDEDDASLNDDDLEDIDFEDEEDDEEDGA